MGPEEGVGGPFAGVGEVGGGAGIVYESAAAVAAACGADYLAVTAGGVGWGSSSTPMVVVSTTTGQADDLADLEGCGVYAGVGAFEVADGDAVVFGDLPEGVAGFHGVRHYDVAEG